MRRVVITGMGAISPVGNDVATLWDNLARGVHGIAAITRFDSAAFKVGVAAEVKDFDPERHGIERGDARRMDLFTQYAMAAAAEAAEDSGIVGAVDSERLGVCVGSGIGGMGTFMAEHQKLLERGPSRVSPLYIPMMIGNIAAGNIAIRYGCQGPCLPVVTACATSTHAVGEAFRQIAHGYADAVMAGGSEATINPLAVAGFTNCKALSETRDPEQASLPFDRRRAGFVMGEGAGIVVLEEYEHARARGATIYAEVVGYGNTCDAHHITAPDPDAAQGARAMRLALTEAGGYEGQLYINAHGTGTPLNDASETLAIKKALGEDAARRALISSTKSMTGHMLGAAGAIELIVSALALGKGVVPPTINLNEPDPACDLDYVPNVARKAQLGAALSVSLGFGGHNGAIALRRTP
ncbi:beta-ketoacyl-ACP synthase II [Bacillota bacterium Meth-B3]|nr:beta-ketoacyl-ACP synthase II [Christensenellaceae bacterium]MEA5065297.1 beta-ketoacyl-ACP synthase II [Eubacteriales bacterium]MEA5068995.1 beta-ketoacyl-ACP synthase II [Christensenellaceae bacterium]